MDLVSTDVRYLLVFSQNTCTIPTPLGDPEVKVIIVEFYLKGFVYN